MPQNGVDTTKHSYAVSRFNSVKHGLRLAITVLPHESEEAHQELLGKFMEEYEPQGATQTVLVQELAAISWRMRRVRMAECANINEGLARVLRNSVGLVNSASPFRLHVDGYESENLGAPVRRLLSLDEAGLEVYRQELQEKQDSLRNARKRLEAGGRGAARRALDQLAEPLQALWYGRDRYSGTINDVARFIESEAEPAVRQEQEIFSCVRFVRIRRLEVRSMPFILTQLCVMRRTWIVNVKKTLAMLIKLKTMEWPARNSLESLEK